MNRVGKARNSRLNQAAFHMESIAAVLRDLRGFSSDKHIENDDAWADGRNAVEQLVQCFHEANAYNNAMENSGAVGSGRRKPSTTTSGRATTSVPGSQSPSGVTAPRHDG